MGQINIDNFFWASAISGAKGNSTNVAQVSGVLGQNNVEGSRIKKKIENIDEKTCYLMQLSQIPYISNTIAKNISNIYPSMTSLILALNEVDDKNKELCKIEGIGKEKASYIIKYLFNK